MTLALTVRTAPTSEKWYHIGSQIAPRSSAHVVGSHPPLMEEVPLPFEKIFGIFLRHLERRNLYDSDFSCPSFTEEYEASGV